MDAGRLVHVPANNYNLHSYRSSEGGTVEHVGCRQLPILCWYSGCKLSLYGRDPDRSDDIRTSI
ncbi:hypothetical protein DPMN_138352 [Dreissena polymorpha]|uniref:Uncharacterized protein n=1 Tax=Dreissena polymorpha TaxID=45954 RepID=A0A9D4G7G2_DREPO|nr:hypothetical protein DPMN_138352 [Dreissena polymorpha]